MTSSRALTLLAPVAVATSALWGLWAWQALPDGRMPAQVVSATAVAAAGFDAPLRSMSPSTEQTVTAVSSGQWKLLGTVAAVKGQSGVALLQGPSGVVTLRVGAKTEDGWTLQSVASGKATLVSGSGDVVDLETPAPQ